jgi:hypothetical protein
VLKHERQIQEQKEKARRAFLRRPKTTGLQAEQLEQLELFDENA